MNEKVPIGIKVGGALMLGGLGGIGVSSVQFYREHPEISIIDSGSAFEHADFSKSLAEWGSAEWSIASTISLIFGFLILAYSVMKAQDGDDHHGNHH